MLTLMVLSGSSATSAFHPTILPVHKILHQLGNIIAHFFPVKLLNFFNFCFLIFGLHFCSRMGRHKDKEKDKRPPKPRKCGSAHKGGDLNAWDEDDMQRAMIEYHK